MDSGTPAQDASWTGPPLLGLVAGLVGLVLVRILTPTTERPTALDEAVPELAVESELNWSASLLIALGIGVATGGTAAAISVRTRRDRRRLVEDLARLNRSESSSLAHGRRRVSLPNDLPLRDVALHLNELLENLGDRIDTLGAQGERQRLAIESMTAGVLVLDPDGSISSANRAASKLFGIDVAPDRSTPLAELVWEPELHDLVDLARRTGEPQRRVFRSSLSTLENARELSAAVAPILKAEADRSTSPLAGFALLVEDATYLRHLERARTEFVGNVSHELRTPITALLGYLETVKELDADEVDTQRRFLDIAHRNAQRLARIIEDLLSLASLENADRELDQDPIRLRPLLESVAERNRTDDAADGPRIEVTCEEQLEATGVANLIEQAVDNLTSNAVRYGNPDGTIRLQARATETGITLLVADDGPGIPPRHIPRLFERFYRVDTARSRASGGTGLGLAIVKHIAVAHGGRVRVESQLGKGATFLLDLPATQSTGSPPLGEPQG